MNETPNLSIWRNLKIALFHLGSGMADVITTGTWNRIMITDLGFSATPIGFLVALRYFLAPLGVWAGRMSDRRALGGYRRLSWIWLGRAMMAFSIFSLGWVTSSLASGDPSDAFHWLVIIISLLLFSLGTAISGSTFLALIYDRTGDKQRGRAVGIVWTFLLIGFTIGGILFGVLLPSGETGAVVEGTARTLPFTPQTIQTLFFAAAGALAVLWFISLVGEERRSTGAVVTAEGSEHATSLREDLKLAWNNQATRWFFWFLGLSMLFAFSQDLILEPFGGEVFGMDPSHTTRFAAYWGSMSILATIVFLFVGRRFKSMDNTRMSIIGVVVLIIAFAIFAISAFAGVRGMVTVGLIVLGLGLGIWNVGTLGLMMEMSPFGRAGTFLGFWSLVVTIGRGIGVSGGGVALDTMRAVFGTPATAYGVVFAIGGIGLAVSLYALLRINVTAFKTQYGRVESTPEQVFAASMD